LESFHRTLTDL